MGGEMKIDVSKIVHDKLSETNYLKGLGGIEALSDPSVVKSLVAYVGAAATAIGVFLTGWKSWLTARSSQRITLKSGEFEVTLEGAVDDRRVDKAIEMLTAATKNGDLVNNSEESSNEHIVIDSEVLRSENSDPLSFAESREMLTSILKEGKYRRVKMARRQR